MRIGKKERTEQLTKIKRLLYDGDDKIISNFINTITELAVAIKLSSQYSTIVTTLGPCSWIDSQYDFFIGIARSELFPPRIRSHYSKEFDALFMEYIPALEHDERNYVIENVLIKGKLNLYRAISENIEIYQFLYTKAPSLLSKSIIAGFEERHQLFKSLIEIMMLGEGTCNYYLHLNTLKFIHPYTSIHDHFEASRAQ